MTTPTVFITGATGSQGSALAHHLRRLNWAVHSTARNLSSPAAQALTAIGVQLTPGSWDDEAALASAMAGCSKMFLCLLPDFGDPTRELRQAGVMVRVAREAGVKQVVASTSLGVFTLEEEGVGGGGYGEGRGGVVAGSVMAGHLANKKGIEEVVRGGGFERWAFLRPAFFMANFLEPKIARYPEPREKGTWTTAMTPEAPLALIDHVDIAAFAAAVFQQPDRFHDRAFGLASELLTVQETLDALGEAAGRSLKAVFMTDEEIAEKQRTSNVFTNSQVSLRYAAKYIDMEEVASVIRPTSFKDFLEREKEGVKKTYV